MSGYLLAGDHSSHLQELNKRYPYGLLTDDFGILNEKDLKINSCGVEPEVFSERSKVSPYAYWQCFEVKNSKMTCEYGSYDAHEEAHMSMLVLSGNRNNERHEFISRRPMSTSSCRLFQKEWRRLTKNEQHVCISGLYALKKIESSMSSWTWIFGRYKTQKGCDSYFQDECNNLKNCAN